jgi:hypothetical protein
MIGDRSLREKQEIDFDRFDSTRGCPKSFTLPIIPAIWWYQTYKTYQTYQNQRYKNYQREEMEMSLFPPMPLEPDTEPTIPEGIGAKQLLQMVYRGEVKLSAQQMRAAIECLPFEEPKLSAVGFASISGQDFAHQLELAVERGRTVPPRVIEHRANEDERRG